MDGGFVKLYRKIVDWEWYKDQNTKALFLHLMIRANWGVQNFRGDTIYCGQLVTSIRSLADETGLSVQEVRTAISHLKATHEIEVDATHKYTLITVVNWRFYQKENGELNTDLFDEPNKRSTQI